MSRPREGLRSGCGTSLGSGLSPNQRMNEILREAVWDAEPAGPIEIEPVAAGSEERSLSEPIRVAVRSLTHRLRR